jgi:hypothetical protein
MTTFAEYAAQTESEKVVLATINSIKQYKLFTLHSGSVYKKTVSYFVDAVQQGTSYYTKATSTTLSASQFYYDINAGILYIRTSDSSDPVTKEIFVTHKHFYSSKPVILPYDLSTGSDVEWDGRISDIGELTLEVDAENTGIAVESDSSLKLLNQDGHFDSLFDTHIWENQEAKFYAWSPSIAVTEAKLIYDGLINNKTFSTKEVGFTLKDLLFKLRSTITHTVFSSTDGTVDDDKIGKPKPIIIGRASKHKCVGIDKVLSGFAYTPSAVQGSADRNLLTGTMGGTSGTAAITGVGTTFTTQISNGEKIRFFMGSLEYNYTVQTVNSNTSITLTGNLSATLTNATARNMDVKNNIVTGTGTAFKTIFSPEDKIIVSVNGTEYKYGIESVDSDTQLTLSDEVKVTFNALTSKCEPAINYRGMNRYWQISGHPLRTYTTTVSTVIDSQWLDLTAIGEIEYGDIVRINGYQYTVAQVSLNKIRLNQVAFAPISASDSVEKVAVFKAYYGPNELVYSRDYTLGSLSDGSVTLELNSLAEFNVTSSITFTTSNLIFTNSSASVTCSDGTLDLSEIFKPRDWLKPKSVTFSVWYEVLQVSATTITLRTNYTDVSYTGVSDYKRPEYIGDDSLICVDCIGLEHNSAWVKTPSQAVAYILDSIGVDNINAATFAAALDDCPYTLSLIYSDNSVKSARDMITDINKSCFGSLYLNSAFEFCFSVLNADQDETVEELTDSDILSFSVSSKQQIVNSLNLEYGPTTNLLNGESYFQKETISSDFVDKTSKIQNPMTLRVSLFNQAEAQNIANRMLLFRSSTQTTVTVKSKLNLFLKSINDRMYLSLDRLFKRFGSNIRKKVGIISKITKNETECSASFQDLGRIIGKVACIAPNATPDFDSATDLNLTQWGYIVDNNTETPADDTEDELGNNLIG